MEVIDTIDNMRNNISNIFKNLNPYILEEDEYYSLLHEILEILKEDNEKYENMLKIIFLDDYRMSYHYVIDGNLEHLEKIEYYEENINSLDDLLLYSTDEINVSEMIQSTLYFNSLSRNEQRTVLTDCKLKDKYLINVSPIHLLDKMFYAYPVDLTPFLQIENKALATLEYSKTIEMLAISDVDSCSKIISELINNYRLFLNKKSNLSGLQYKIKRLLDNEFITISNKILQEEEIRKELLDKYYVLKKLVK